MSGVKHIIQRIREGRLKQLIGELLWMYAYVRRYWFTYFWELQALFCLWGLLW